MRKAFLAAAILAVATIGSSRPAAAEGEAAQRVETGWSNQGELCNPLCCLPQQMCCSVLFTTCTPHT